MKRYRPVALMMVTSVLLACPAAALAGDDSAIVAKDANPLCERFQRSWVTGSATGDVAAMTKMAAAIPASSCPNLYAAAQAGLADAKLKAKAQRPPPRSYVEPPGSYL